MDAKASFFKVLENVHESKIPSNQYVIIRLDGKGFGVFTRPYRNMEPEHPRDTRIQQAMIHACQVLVEYFRGTCAYTQSDEISLVLAPHLFVRIPDESKEPTDTCYSPHMFAGRVEKLASLSASVCSTAFGTAIRAAVQGDPNRDKFYRDAYAPVFDGRCFGVDTEDQVSDYLQWRMADGFRNGVSCYARLYYSGKQMLEKSTPQLLAMLEEEHKRSRDNMHLPSLYGTFVVVQKRIVRQDQDGTHVVTPKQCIAFTLNHVVYPPVPLQDTPVQVLV